MNVESRSNDLFSIKKINFKIVIIFNILCYNRTIMIIMITISKYLQINRIINLRSSLHRGIVLLTWCFLGRIHTQRDRREATEGGVAIIKM